MASRPTEPTRPTSPLGATPSASADNDLWTVGRLLEWTSRYFASKHLDSPLLDTQILLAQVLACTRLELYTLYDAEVAPVDRARFKELVKQRCQHKPVAYMVGYREFYALRFEVTPAVLIPRPETEHLIGAALEMGPKEAPVRFVDVGTGSGAIAVTLAKELPQAHGVALDISPEALAVAQKNAEQHQVSDRLTFRQSDLLAAVAGQTFDLVVSNPPYVATEDWEKLPPDVRLHEPRLALDGGPGGMALVARLVPQAAAVLKPGGLLLIEIGADQEAAVLRLLTLAAAPPPETSTPGKEPVWSEVKVLRDYAGLPRVARARRA